MTYTNLTNEELVERISAGDENAYEQLFRNLRPVILHEAAMYFDKMDTYGVEDLIQECNIVAWQVIARGNFKGGKFSTYFGGAIRNRLCNIYRDYNLKNLVCIGEQEDYHGNITRIFSRTNSRDCNQRYEKYCKHHPFLVQHKSIISLTFSQ